jgi:hypothetical protein
VLAHLWCAEDEPDLIGLEFAAMVNTQDLLERLNENSDTDAIRLDIANAITSGLIEGKGVRDIFDGRESQNHAQLRRHLRAGRGGLRLFAGHAAKFVGLGCALHPIG